MSFSCFLFAFSFGFSGFFLTFSFIFLFVEFSVHEEIDHFVPLLVSGKSSSEIEDLSGEEPKHGGDSFFTLVVTWNSNIDVSSWAISVAQSDGDNVHVGRLLQTSSVGHWVSDDQKSWLDELLGNLIGQGSGYPLGGNCLALGMLRVFNDTSVSNFSVGNTQYIICVLDRCDNSSS
ncbi:unnamed protein product [Moneuplotes crassus]|uniref:Uncharacterized protein n=1 Tax=Euplotes crassus TaxID=5936 RepID=A0AAD2D1Z4_EUPCR|nr:unnamed protein product [Moneuplotes crassus]